MNKRTIALLLNLSLVILGTIGLAWCFFENIPNILLYYTTDSNILAVISSLLFIIFFNKDYKWVRDLRYIATCCLGVTFFVVLFILAPQLGGIKALMFTGFYLFLHFLCPLISIISNLVFERIDSNPFVPLIATGIYAITLIILNLVNYIDGPYPFLRIRHQPFLMTILWIIIIFFLNLIINGIIFWGSNKIKEK